MQNRPRFVSATSPMPLSCSKYPESATLPAGAFTWVSGQGLYVNVGAGNPGAVGVRARYAQHCFTSHVEFRVGSGLAGVREGGNVAEDVRFVGGEYGIWTGTPSPGWQYTLLDARFEGQRRASTMNA